MRILAIDTALEACSIVLMDDAEIVARESRTMARGHAEALMPMLAALRQQTSLDFSSLDRIVVTVGPGSFTGLRVGISAARGIGLAAAKPVIGITTLEAFAAPLIAADPTAPVVAAIDARHDHVYLQAFHVGGATAVSPCVVSVAEALRLVAPFEGPRLVGNAADILRAAWPAGQADPATVDQQAAPQIEWVARLGALADADSAPPKPFYLRAPDAQPQAAAQLARS